MSKQKDFQGGFFKKIEEIVNNIDQAMEGKGDTEKLLVTILPAAALVLGSYFYLFPLMDEFAAKSLADRARQQELFEKNTVLVGDIERQDIVRRGEVELQSFKQRLQVLDQRVKQYEVAISGIHKMNQAWYATLDLATKEAGDAGVEIVNSAFWKDSNASVARGSERYKMTLAGKGAYSAIMNYIFSLEGQGKFVGLEKVLLRPDVAGRSLYFEIILGSQRSGVL